MADHTGFKNDAPVILYRNKASVLVLIDGEPKLQQIDGASVKRIINTPFIIMKPDKDSSYYLYGGDHWMKSSSLTTGWAITKNVPSSVKKAMEKNKQPSDTSSAAKTADDGVVPEIVVSTVPAELLQTKGNPEFKPINETGLLYVDNTDDYIFREISSQKYFILKSGRWYASGGLDGGWKFIPSDSLPADFAKIPPGSDMDAVLASVPGTPQAKDAVLDAQVPQTATVDRKTAGKNATVTYDGAPKFEPVDGTSLFLAVNASKTVFRSGSMYYLVDNGIWFESKNYNGPWEVSTSRPADVDKIPPSNSAYNTRYVYIYDHTPDVVYVGYTPGYMG
ncbi:MAG: carbohydrate-binding family V/XII, partial [Bacteroidota bacterium]